MRQAIWVVLAATMGSAVALPDGVMAQSGRERTRRIEQFEGERIRDRIRDVRQADAARRNGNGPAFCRSGEGHPVHGRAWCRDKGWDRGGRDDGWRQDGYDDDDRERGDRDRDERADRDDGRYDDQRRRTGAGTERWERVDWGDVRFRRSGSTAVRELSRQQLESLLGGRILSQLARHAYEQRLDDGFRGTWREGGRTLRVHAGRVPLAEFTDDDGDGRVDAVRLAFWN